MKQEKIFTNEKLRQRLGAGLQSTAAYLTAAGETIRREIPGVVWCNNFIWALAQRQQLKEYLCHKVRENGAGLLGFDCGYNEPELSLNDDMRLNRKFVERAKANELSAISCFHISPDIEAYLRMGALYIGKDGATIIASNAGDIIAAYCTITADNERERAFIEKVEAMRAAAIALEQSRKEFCSAIYTPGGKEAAERSNFAFSLDSFHVSNGLALASKNVVWRAFVSYCIPARKMETARFYNRVGIPGPVDIKPLLGNITTEEYERYFSILGQGGPRYIYAAAPFITPFPEID